MRIVKKVYLIMSKDRKFIAKGTPRNRYIVRADDEKDRKRFITYTSKKLAENGFENSGFFNKHLIQPGNELEAVEFDMVLEEVKDA